MKYTIDITIPADLATRQLVAEQQHSPQRDAHPAMLCLSAGDCYRAGLINEARWFQHIGESNS